MLEDVDDISVADALHAARQVPPFDRTVERFRLPFELALRLLSGTGHALQTDSVEIFVFLLDMNVLFEQYVHAVLESAFRVPVRRQGPIWYLFPDLAQGRMAQKPDFSLTDAEGTRWIGDAKYKHLAHDQKDSLQFEQGDGRRLTADDVRQLTVYAELDRIQRHSQSPANLILLYPFVGGGDCRITSTLGWNHSDFYLTPIRLSPTEDLGSHYPKA